VLQYRRSKFLRVRNGRSILLMFLWVFFFRKEGSKRGIYGSFAYSAARDSLIRMVPPNHSIREGGRFYSEGGILRWARAHALDYYLKTNVKSGQKFIWWGARMD
jgi:hypothetical protein